MKAANDNASAQPYVRSLKLEFSRAADYPRIDELFSPAVKDGIDPHGYVVKRLDTHFRAAVASQAAAMLTDEHGRVMTLTIAYRVNHVRKPGNDNSPDGRGHDVTELGTSLARLPGYNSAKLVVAALTLREWWNNPPRDAMIAEIKRDNTASLKTYIDGLHWKPLTDAAHSVRLYDATDVTLADDKDKGSSKPKNPSEAKSLWHRCDDATIAQSARVILTFMAQGGLLNKATGHRIAVDFTALEQAGLTRERLLALAGGKVDRQALRAIPTQRAPGL